MTPKLTQIIGYISVKQIGRSIKSLSLFLQDVLNKMRNVDDKIVYMLNTSIPTESFKAQMDPSATCKQLYDQVIVDFVPP